MPKLSDKALKDAVDYNRARRFPDDTWAQVQMRIGATVDGEPGPKTTEAVAEFQARHGLTVDGLVGPVTLSALGVALPSSNPIRAFPGESAFFYHGKLAVDADGAPNAYNEQDTGIDYLRNAGRPGNWWALSCDEQGEPYKQGDSDPCPGYYISTTALCDGRFDQRDPRRYVDATKIPYIVLPRNLAELRDGASRVRKGDLAAVLRIDRPGDIVFSIYADVGPSWEPGEVLGEGSIALAQALGHDPYRNGRVVRGIPAGLFFVVFPGSGEGVPLPADEIARRGRQAFDSWGGASRLEQALWTTTTRKPS